MTTGVYGLVVVVAFSSLARIFGTMFDHSFRACAFFLLFSVEVEISAKHTNSTLHATISPQWLSELRRLRPSVP